MAGGKLINLTNDELERLITVFSCNIDINMVPQMQEHAKRGNVDSVMAAVKAIEFDKQILQKLLERA